MQLRYLLRRKMKQMKEYYDSNGRLAHPGSTAIPEIEEKEKCFQLFVYDLQTGEHKQKAGHFFPIGKCVRWQPSRTHLHCKSRLCVCVCMDLAGGRRG